jgi:uncharacterized protein
MKAIDIKEKYLRLRDELDTEIKRLESVHSSNMLCKKGCDLCCVSFKVFPLEFDVIASEISETPISHKLDDQDDKCSLLVDKNCIIYASRPFICRTHGLPLVYMNDEEWVLSHCELNFNEVDEDYFSETELYEQDKWNSKLYMLNQEYLNSMDEQKYEANQLIALSELINNINFQ